MLNVSLAALIMLTTFLMMDDEAIKYLKRRTREFFGDFDSHQIETKTKPRRQKESNVCDIYVIDLEM